MKKEIEMKKFLERSKGFTLVELMVVIAIIGILAVVALGIVRGAQTRAKDSTIQATASNLSTALESYYAINNEFPDEIADLADDALGGVMDKVPELASPCTVDDGGAAPECGINYEPVATAGSNEGYNLYIGYLLLDPTGDGSNTVVISGGVQ